MEYGAFGMPIPQGWTIERLVSLLAGTVVIATQVAGGPGSARLRVLTGWVGVNSVLNAIVGWCPMSVLLHRLGVRTVAERAGTNVAIAESFSADAARNR
ncbi:hypothetical protein A5653_23280 [Mycobacterium colombiense]|nr:hypothetical protein A5653_23280 [Mycobacterium colombiense]